MKKLKEKLRYQTLPKMWNRVKGEIDFRQRRIRVSGYPWVLIVEPCNFCNLKCPLCPTGQRLEINRGIMNLATFNRIMEELHPYLRHLNLFFLGEPLFCENLHQMIATAHRCRIRTTVSSNFNMLDEAKAEGLIRSGLDLLIISLDGASPETYAYYRVGGNFYKVLDNLEIFLQKKRELQSDTPQIQLQFVVFKHNYPEIAQARELARQRGVDFVVREGALGGENQSPPLLKDAALAKQWLHPCANQHFDYFSDKPYIQSGACTYLWKSATINWDGSVFPCCWVYDPKLCFGNILHQPFHTIWNNHLFMSARSLFSEAGQTSGALYQQHQTICHLCKMYKHALNAPS